MTQNSADKTFWKAQITDGWSSCKGSNTSDRCTPDPLVPAELGYKDDAFYGANTENASDWAAPFQDNDPEDPWCTKVNTTDGAAKIAYECSKIRCVMERLLDTKNTVQDLKFSPTEAAADKLVILPGRAKVYIN